MKPIVIILVLIFFFFINTSPFLNRNSYSVLKVEADLVESSYYFYPENYEQIELPNVNGPESFAFDCHGKGPYTGVSDGRILKWEGSDSGWREFAISSPNRPRNLCDGSKNPETEAICGRPLGLKFSPKSCDLYIADPYFGLLVVGPNGGVARPIVTSAEGVPFGFPNGLDIDTHTGLLYFTDSSTVFITRESPLLVNTKDKTGRLLQYDPSTNKTTVLLRGLAFANGVALSNDSSFLLVAESTTQKILKVWLRGPKAHTSELFVQLDRGPDNIKRTRDGDFWVGLNTGLAAVKSLPADRLVLAISARSDRSRILKMSGQTFETTKIGRSKIKTVKNFKVRNQNFGIDSDISLEPRVEDPVGVKFDGEGTVVGMVDGGGDSVLDCVSEVDEHAGFLWFGSPVKGYVGLIKKKYISI